MFLLTCFISSSIFGNKTRGGTKQSTSEYHIQFHFRNCRYSNQSLVNERKQRKKNQKMRTSETFFFFNHFASANTTLTVTTSTGVNVTLDKNSSVIYVVEQSGVITVWESVNQTFLGIFLNISDRVMYKVNHYQTQEVAGAKKKKNTTSLTHFLFNKEPGLGLLGFDWNRDCSLTSSNSGSNSNTRDFFFVHYIDKKGFSVISRFNITNDLVGNKKK